MDAIFKPSTRIGFGNILFHLYDYVKKYGPQAPVHTSLNDYERGKAFQFHVNFTNEIPTKEIQLDIYCNSQTFREMAYILPKIISPQTDLLNLKHKFKTGIHIRCGSWAPDCKGLAAPHDAFVSEATFKTLDTLIPTLPRPIFLASDSQQVKELLKSTWGDIIEVFDTQITLTCDPNTCGGAPQTNQSLMDAYVEWYTLSQCDHVITTMGPGFSPETLTGAGVSTFGFTAAAYGQKPLLAIGFDGGIFRF